MYKYCPVTGEPLRRIADFPRYWCTVYQSTAGGYLEVGHARWVYPLLNIEPEVVERLQNSSHTLVDEAFARLKRIDCKTISTLAFEQTLLGRYQASVDGNGQSHGKASTNGNGKSKGNGLSHSHLTESRSQLS